MAIIAFHPTSNFNLLGQIHRSANLGPDGSLRYRCSYCVNYFKSIEDRTAHVATVHKEESKCKMCDKSFQRKDKLREHVKRHGNMHTTLAHTVPFHRALNSFLKISIATGPDGSLRYRCECCPIYFQTSDDRNWHLETVHQEKIICTVCDKTFRKMVSLKSHYKAHHKWQEKIQQFVCMKCSECLV